MAPRCLCCQQPLDGAARYHDKCLKALWGKVVTPHIAFSLADLPAKVAAAEGPLSIPGVQAKVLVRLNKQSSEIEIAPTGSTHILKPEPDKYPGLPAMENVCMSMASALGLPVPPHGLFPLSDGRLCYIIKRFDRAEDGGKIQQETMFQLLGAVDKYQGSLEALGQALRAHTENVGLDMIDFFERVLFCFLTGNGDMHLKNWALFVQGKKVSLAPCYDFVSSAVYITNDDDSTLTIGAKKKNLARADFENFAVHLKIDTKAAASSFAKMRNSQEKLREMALCSELSLPMRQSLADVQSERFRRIFSP